MSLYITEADVNRLVTVPDTIRALDEAFRRQAAGLVINQPRRRLYLPSGAYNTMVAADLGLNTFAIKAYTSFRPGTRFLVLLYDATNGDLLATIEADRLGQIRTGAATGVAVSYLTRSDQPLDVGIFGAGWQAESQLRAICAVRNVAGITVCSRDAARLDSFCRRMEQELRTPVSPAAQPEAAATGKDVVITATTSREPVLFGAWLQDGATVCVIGGNALYRREVDEEVVRRSAFVVVDSREQAQCEAGELVAACESRIVRWEQVAELCDVVAGTRRAAQRGITLFKSLGIALEDVAVATLAYWAATAGEAT